MEDMGSKFALEEDYPYFGQNDYCKQDYLPRDLLGRKYYEFGKNKTEQAAKTYYDYIRSCQDKRK